MTKCILISREDQKPPALPGLPVASFHMCKIIKFYLWQTFYAPYAYD